MSEMIGRELEGYRIEAELGRGGQAIVYRATQLSLQRTVALKVVSPQLSSDDNFKERFTREGIAAANLDHPHVIQVFEAGEAGGLAFLSMKFVDGPSFDAVVHAPGGVTPRRTLSILRQVAEALDYMAQRGMVHRDVKPANVLLGPGDHAYLSDFGLIKAISEARLTSSGVWMGTLEYVAPEQIRGGEITPAADRYALAAMAFEALTGRTLFPREDRTATLFAHVNDEPPAASGLNPHLGPPVDAVLARGLAKQPEDRFLTAVAFADELAAAVAATPGAADAPPPLARSAATPPPPPPPPTGDPAPAGATVTGDGAPPTITGDRERPLPDRRRLAIMGGAVLAAGIAIVLAIMFATGAIGGEGRTTTVFVPPTTSASVPTPPETLTGPEGETVGAALTTSIPGWEIIPAGPEIGNLTVPSEGTVESAQVSDGGRIALVAALRMPDEAAARAAFLELGGDVVGPDAGAPDLGLPTGDAWLRDVRDGAALGFVQGGSVHLVLAADGPTAQELGRALAAG